VAVVVVVGVVMVGIVESHLTDVGTGAATSRRGDVGASCRLSLAWSGWHGWRHARQHEGGRRKV
jgi:hypothetical protein